ncbi:MAG: hypothetical protein Q9M91_02920 [Candidatus Dojkabacteria bacterium]|nr:hypothetical protein [Candidatus Dojkabacteria bacterium]
MDNLFVAGIADYSTRNIQLNMTWRYALASASLISSYFVYDSGLLLNNPDLFGVEDWIPYIF